jgi:hypothetical protein
MHRSGTSAITRALAVLGVDLGSRLMPPQIDNNEKGFFEDIDVNGLNIEILAGRGLRWDSLQSFEVTEVGADQRARLVKLLEGRLASCGDAGYGMKDPRLCRLLPLWRRAFAECSASEAYILCLRDPLSVADSLKRRDGFPAVKSAYLWLLHTLSAIVDSRGAPRIVVSYDAMLAAPDVELTRIATLLGRNVPDMSAPESLQFVEAFLDASLKHSGYSNEEVLGAPDVPVVAARLYQALQRVARDELSLDSEELGLLVSEATEFVARQAPLLYLVDSLEDAAASSAERENTHAALYWAEGEGGFDETRVVARPIAFGEVATLGIPSVEDATATRRVRLDPMEGAGALVLHLCARACGTERVIEGEAIVGCSADTRCLALGEGRLLFVSSSDDPWMEVELPPGCEAVSIAAEKLESSSILAMFAALEAGTKGTGYVGEPRFESVQRALDETQTLAVARYEEIGALSEQLERTQVAQDESSRLALERAAEISRLETQLGTTHAALEVTQGLAVARVKEIADQQRALEDAQGLATERYEEIRALSEQLERTQTAQEESSRLALERAMEVSRLEVRLRATQAALEDTQSLAVARVDKIADQQRALEDAQGLATARYEETRKLSEQLERTQAAQEESSRLALERATEISRLDAQLSATQTALEEAQGLALARFKEAAIKDAQLGRTQAALEEVEVLAHGRAEELAQFALRLNQTQAALEEVQALAISRSDELARFNEQLDRTHAALAEVQRLAVTRAIENEELTVQLESTKLALLEGARSAEEQK